MRKINLDPNRKFISDTIPPNYSTWNTIELSYQCARYCIEENITGSFVECGVASGNNLAVMCKAGRHGYGFDSFEGIPWAGPKDTEQPGIGKKTVQITWHDDFPVKNYVGGGHIDDSLSSGVTVHSYESVTDNMQRWGITNYSLIKGWFQNTVPHWLGEIAVLRLDGDLYDSTYVALRYLYPFVTEGGILIMDDWNLDGCRMAFEDYFRDRSMDGKPKLIFDNGVTYWQK